MSIQVIEACFVISKMRGDNTIIVHTMSAMPMISAISPSPLNISSVPLMGGASGIGLGLAIAQPDRKVVVLDGDASLLMEMGGMAQIGDQAPANLIHVVFNNNTQFGGVANLDRPGGAAFDFCAVAKASGYATANRYSIVPELVAGGPALIETPGPHFVELEIARPSKFTRESPQLEFPDTQFQRMGAEAQAMMGALGVSK
ncbi:thiamine pyrophosphate-dependent enzyme [Alisedimentitalea sp. MJ-SS2]|uniref:thiamine pyrophosphate-dependent enzyme n=1 Tax=Aliisedimentitalea sp. MJ-SS2 TaxID=3049795 RepID=UPI00290E472F|nr:thiamine pyrophosphate-dependent enzyme [Alisedimentitalea sp. MJ-SS2]MDU8929124.1 thiamine pyrophosphate-dependent enzyme [Alisedimentitalea sp. MJ-SS2]